MGWQQLTRTNSSYEAQTALDLCNKKIIICIPAYNEERNIKDIIKKAQKYATEVLVYDDGSSDSTSEVARISGATVVRNPINRGYGSAITTLFLQAKARDADVMITVDSDGQHDPDQIPRIMEPILRDQSDIVIGSRFLNANEKSKVPRYRSFGIKAITRVTCAASYSNITDAQSGFRAYSKIAMAKIDLFEEGMQVSTEILLKAKEKNLRIEEVPISVNYDLNRTSTHNPMSHGMKVLLHVIQIVSLRHPLLFYGCPGIILLLISAFFANNTLELFSQTRFVSTNMILISIGLAVVGAIFLATGAIVYTLVALFKGKLKEV
jgi:glycosyltransferase involved in cell wall biosynthesis